MNRTPSKSELRKLFAANSTNDMLVWKATRCSSCVKGRTVTSKTVTIDGIKYSTARLVYSFYRKDPGDDELVYLDGNRGNIAVGNLELSHNIERVPSKVTCSYLRKIFNYDKNTGILTWKEQPVFGRTTVKLGEVVGYHNARGYLEIRLCNKTHRSHRIIWLMVYKKWPTHVIDHINGIKDDNRISNLRDVPQEHNVQNGTYKSATGTTGVTKRGSKYEARISVDNKCIYLGSSTVKSEAIKMAVDARKKYHKGYVEAKNKNRKRKLQKA